VTIDLHALLAGARASGELSRLLEAIPYARFLGLTVQRDPDDGTPRATMQYADHLIGDAGIPAIHGGTLAALMESGAILRVLADPGTTILPRTITITIDYLRSARAVDTHCKTRIIRQGRRVAVVWAEAYQDDPDKPVASAVVHLLVAE
jgi:uncharacterized protein (TIGR00369 family)